MSEERCKHECTCKNSLGHYLVVIGGFLRLASVIIGVAFSSEAADMKSPKEVQVKLDNLVEMVEAMFEDEK